MINETIIQQTINRVLTLNIFGVPGRQKPAECNRTQSFKAQDSFPGIKEDFNLQIKSAYHVSMKTDSYQSIQKCVSSKVT